jgi:hypothetical protein
MKHKAATIHISVKVHLSLWSAIKLRIAGVYPTLEETLEKDADREEGRKANG